MATDGFKQWCIIELFGHTRVAGLLTEARWPPGFARLEIPGDDKHQPSTHFYNPTSFFGLHPVTEEIARNVCANCRPEVVHPWEMPIQPRLPAKAACDHCGEQDCEGECVEEEEPYYERAEICAHLGQTCTPPCEYADPGECPKFAHAQPETDPAPPEPPPVAMHTSDAPPATPPAEPASLPSDATLPSSKPPKPVQRGMIACSRCGQTGEMRDGSVCSVCQGSGSDVMPF